MLVLSSKFSLTHSEWIADKTSNSQNVIVSKQNIGHEMLHQKIKCLKNKIHQMQADILKICYKNTDLTDRLEKDITHSGRLHKLPSSVNQPKICRTDQKIRMTNKSLLKNNINEMAKHLSILEHQVQHLNDKQEALELEEEFDSKIFEDKYKKLESQNLQLNRKFRENEINEIQTI